MFELKTHEPVGISNRTRLVFSLLILLQASVLPSDAERSQDSPELQDLQLRLRDTEEKRRQTMEQSVPIATTVRLSEVESDPKKANVALIHSGSSMGCVWTLTPLDFPEQPPVRACVGGGRQQFLRLKPGHWKIELRAGLVGHGSAVYAPVTMRLARGSSHQSVFDREQEQSARKKLTDAERIRLRAIRKLDEREELAPENLPQVNERVRR